MARHDVPHSSDHWEIIVRATTQAWSTPPRDASSSPMATRANSEVDRQVDRRACRTRRTRTDTLRSLPRIAGHAETIDGCGLGPDHADGRMFGIGERSSNRNPLKQRRPRWPPGTGNSTRHRPFVIQLLETFSSSRSKAFRSSTSRASPSATCEPRTTWVNQKLCVTWPSHAPMCSSWPSWPRQPGWFRSAST